MYISTDGGKIWTEISIQVCIVNSLLIKSTDGGDENELQTYIVNYRGT